MFHRCKYGKIEEGYQYCLKCGKAILAPVAKCQHVWVLVHTEHREDYDPHSIYTRKFIRFIDRCSICGDMRRTDL